MKDILENKWTTVVKLKKQVMELEKQVKQLKESAFCQNCANGSGNGFGLDGKGLAMVGEGLPKVPEKHSLVGHREKITKVQIHPNFTLIASAS